MCQLRSLEKFSDFTECQANCESENRIILAGLLDVGTGTVYKSSLTGNPTEG